MSRYCLTPEDIGVPWKPYVTFCEYKSFQHFRQTATWGSKDGRKRNIFAIQNDHLIAIVNWILDHGEEDYPHWLFCFMYKEAMRRGFHEDLTPLWTKDETNNLPRRRRSPGSRPQGRQQR